MSINKLVSIKVPILEAFGDIGLDHTKNYPDFVRWAVRAEKEIGSAQSLQRLIRVLTVDKYRAELPCEAMYVQKVLLGDFGKDAIDLFDYYCNPNYNAVFTASDTFLVVDNPGASKEVIVGRLKWEVQDNHIILSGNYDKQKITVQILGIDKDEDGLPKVCENHVEAIVAHIQYRYALRSRFTPNKMDMGDVQTLLRNWGSLAAEARAMDDQPSESDHKEMVRLLHNSFSGYGFEVNMHNRQY